MSEMHIWLHSCYTVCKSYRFYKIWIKWKEWLVSICYESMKYIIKHHQYFKCVLFFLPIKWGKRKMSAQKMNVLQHSFINNYNYRWKNYVVHCRQVLVSSLDVSLAEYCTLFWFYTHQLFTFNLIYI